VAEWLQTTRPAVLTAYTLLAVTMFSRVLFGLSWAAIILGQLWRTRPHWRRLLTISVLSLLLVPAGSLLLFPSVKNSVGAFVSRDFGSGKAKVDLSADQELYTWARTQTPKDSLFFYGSPLFRFRAQRSITHALGDLINHREARYVEIFRRYHRLEKAFQDPVVLLSEAKALEADYIVVEKSKQICLPLPLLFQNKKYLVYQLPSLDSEKAQPHR
jgi:hypothetical protein